MTYLSLRVTSWNWFTWNFTVSGSKFTCVLPTTKVHKELLGRSKYGHTYWHI